MAENNPDEALEEFKYLIDSRNLTKKEKALERDAILKAREARLKNRSEFEVKVARLLQLKYQMEDYLLNPNYDYGPYFSKFLTIYVDTLYKKRRDFASDVSIDPIVLSQVLNNHRDPQESFLHRLSIHSMGSYKDFTGFSHDLWPRVYFRDKVCKFLSTQALVRESEATYVKSAKIDPDN